MTGEIPGTRQYTATEALGVSARRYYEDYGAHADSTVRGIPGLPGDPAGDWLKANDPRLRAEGVSDDMQAALEAEGLTVDEARAAFPKTGGKPTRAVAATRARIAAALLPLWQDDYRRGLMADALDCDRKTLRRLMSKPPKLPHAS
jgi:hypothetical protein